MDAVATNASRIASFNLTSWGKLPIKLYTWESWEKHRIPYPGESEGYMAHLKPVVADFQQLIASAYSTNLIDLAEVEKTHDAGFAFLYGDENEAKNRTVGVEAFFFRKVKNWTDNPMVDSYGFDVEFFSPVWTNSPIQIPSEKGISCNQGLFVAGAEANLRAASKNKKKYVSTVPSNIPERMLLPELHQQLTAETNALPLAVAKRPGGPEVVAAVDTTFDQIPLKTFVWNSFLDIMPSRSISKLKDIVEEEQERQLLRWFYGAGELNKNHDTGVSFLYGYTDKTKGKMMGVGLVLFQKTEKWSDNPMVDARVIETAVEDFGKPLKIPGSNGILCNAEMRIAGEVSALRNITANLQEFVNTPVKIPVDLLSTNLRKEQATRIKVS